MLKKYSYIYLTTNLINGKQYVGQHSTNNMNDGYVGSGTIMLKAIKKYGKENFKVDVMQFCINQEEMDFFEDKYIIWYETMSPKGYNLRSGGHERFIISDELREILKNSHIGYEYSDEQRINHKKAMNREDVKAKLSEASKRAWSDPNIREKYLIVLKDKDLVERRRKSFIGYKHSDESKEKMSRIQKNRKHSDKQNNMQSDIMKQKIHIYNPENGEKRMIHKDEEIPEGFIRGRGKLKKT